MENKLANHLAFSLAKTRFAEFEWMMSLFDVNLIKIKTADVFITQLGLSMPKIMQNGSCIWAALRSGHVLDHPMLTSHYLGGLCTVTVTKIDIGCFEAGLSRALAVWHCRSDFCWRFPSVLWCRSQNVFCRITCMTKLWTWDKNKRRSPCMMEFSLPLSNK